MGELVLLIVAAAWAAVLLPPLLRSRFENRPNSSVTDFNRQLARLQGSVPSRTTTSMRSAARPLAGSQVAAQSRRDAAAARRRRHGSPSLEGVQTPRQPMSAAEVQRRRRANVFVGLLVTTVCLLFLQPLRKRLQCCTSSQCRSCRCVVTCTSSSRCGSAQPRGDRLRRVTIGCVAELTRRYTHRLRGCSSVGRAQQSHC